MRRTETPPAILLGLIGQGIQASRTPEMHMAEGAAQALRLVYRLIDLTRLGLSSQALPDLLAAAERTGFTGLNITHPCKQQVIAHLDDLAPDARALGAVNTVLFRDGRRIGHNTDWSGFAAAFRQGMPGAPLARVAQLGAGGAGAAVAYAALTLGVGELALFDVDPTRAEALAESLCRQFGAGRARAATDRVAVLAAVDGLINATPIGMDAHPGLPLDPDLLRPEMWVAEVIYFPVRTALLERAGALGCRTLDGTGMAVGQAAAAFRLFTGREPDVARMTRCFNEQGP